MTRDGRYVGAPGSYGSGLGTYIMLMVGAGVVTLVLRWLGI